MPRHGQVLGLVGSNGTGKSTALKILSGKIKPNLGRFDVSMRDMRGENISFQSSSARVLNKRNPVF